MQKATHLGVPYQAMRRRFVYPYWPCHWGRHCRFSTSNGLVAHDLGGTIQEAVKLEGTGGLALISTADSFDQSGRLVFLT